MKYILVLLMAALASAAPDSRTVAARLAARARKAQDSNQTVRAYLLYAEAAARDPMNVAYRSNRDALAPAAKLLTQSNVEDANVHDEIAQAEAEAAHPEPPIERISSQDWRSPLQAPPSVEADPGFHDFDLTNNAKSLLESVTMAYGMRAVVDHDLVSGKPIHFELQHVDFRGAMEALTAATHTFVFPISKKIIDFAADTEIKRNELEPIVLLTFPLQDALTEKDLIDAANAVRSVLSMRAVGWDSVNRMVMIRDHTTRATVARSLMEALLLPPPEVSFEVQFLTLDTDRSLHYGVSLQTLFQFVDFGKIGGIKSVLPQIVGSSTFATFGGGATLFGVGVAEAQAFAQLSNSVASAIYDATVRVSDRQTASIHIGDKYPIATSLYTGFTQGAGSIYNPAPQITMEDLGLVLKISPHVNGDGDIDMDLEADVKSLGTQTYNTIPTIAERIYKGTVSLREGEWAIVAGMDAITNTYSRSGLAGFGNVPGLKQLLTETNREDQTSKTLLVIKPTITRLPMTGVISPQYLLGPRRGERVLL